MNLKLFVLAFVISTLVYMPRASAAMDAEVLDVGSGDTSQSAGNKPAPEASHIDEEYQELFSIAQEYPSQNDPQTTLDRMLAFISQRPAYKPQPGKGISLIQVFPSVQHKFEENRWREIEQRIEESIRSLLKRVDHGDIDQRILRLAKSVELQCALATESIQEGPDVNRLRSKLEAYLLLSVDPFESARLQERYINILARVDLDAAVMQVESMPQNPARVKALAQGLLNQLNLRRAPMEMSFVAIDDKPVDLSNLRGKVVLVTFTGITWCYGCRLQEPFLKAAFEKHHDAGFEIISVTNESGSNQEKVRKLIEEMGLGWPHYFDGKGLENPYIKKYGINGFPTHFLLNKKGLLVSTDAYGKRLEPLVRSYLEEEVRPDMNKSSGHASQ